MSKDLDSEWLEALEVEEPDTPDVPDEDEKKDDEPEEKTDDNVPAGTDDDDDGDKPADDKSADDEADDEDKEAEEKPAPNLTKEALKEAIQEIETSKADRSNTLNDFKAEVSKTLYPEGLSRQLRDSEGDPITGIEDLVQLINPATQEYFTDEEAGAWLLREQKKLNEDVQVVEKFIEDVAEVNLAIQEGSERVIQKHGKILKENPELTDRLLAGYNKTLIKDPESGVAIKAPVTVEEFFDLALEPMILQQTKEADAAAKANAEAKKKAEKRKQSERADLRFSGKSENMKPEDKEWAEAIKSYEEGV